MTRYSAEWGIEPTREAIYQHLGDDCRWVMVNAYHHPESLPEFDPALGMDGRGSLSRACCLAGAETLADMERYPWPN